MLCARRVGELLLNGETADGVCAPAETRRRRRSRKAPSLVLPSEMTKWAQRRCKTNKNYSTLYHHFATLQTDGRTDGGDFQQVSPTFPVGALEASVSKLPQHRNTDSANHS